MPTGPDSINQRLLTGILAGVLLQGLAVLGTSALGILEWSWIASCILLIAFLFYVLRVKMSSSADDWHEIAAAWRSPWPWLMAILLFIQIVAYPPTMSDSLCYRLPRLFLALQEGGIGRFPSEDERINGMPWGWEFLAIPFAALNHLNASKLINLCCWGVFYQILYSFALQRSSQSHARWIALSLSTAPVFVLQASSTANDLYAATLILIGTWMIHRFKSAPGPVPVMASLLSLVLAANVKPQFLVLGLPWLAWWSFSPAKPWKHVPWHVLAIAAPVYFLVSPLWLLFENHQLTGTLLGAGKDEFFASNAPEWIMILAGVIQLASAQLQLPVFPGADSFSSTLQNIPVFQWLHGAVPKFSPVVHQIIIVDGASIGLVHSILLAAGLFLCIRRSHLPCWPWIATFAFGLMVSSSQIVPGSIGRSFVGFFSLLLPLAAVGLSGCERTRRCSIGCSAAILSGLAVICLNPASPLWPSRTMQSIVEHRQMHGLAQSLERYHKYQERAQTGLNILNPVPHGETVGVLVRRITPISTLWQPDWRAHRIEFVNHIPPGTFNASSTKWLVVGDKAAEFLPEEAKLYSNLPGWRIIHQLTYLPNLSQGNETWTLYRREDP